MPVNKSIRYKNRIEVKLERRSTHQRRGEFKDHLFVNIQLESGEVAQ